MIVVTWVAAILSMLAVALSFRWYGGWGFAVAGGLEVAWFVAVVEEYHKR